MALFASICGLVVAVPVGLGLFIYLAYRWEKRGVMPQRRRAASVGVVPNEPPSPDDLRVHLPADATSLLALDLGPNSERILELFHHGELARGMIIEHEGVLTQVRPRTSTVSSWSWTYGWYDRGGGFHLHDTTDPDNPLLNRSMTAIRNATFVVAFDPATDEHVIFYGLGGRRLTVPEPVAAKPPPQPANLSTGSFADERSRVVAISDNRDDPGALRVIADHLLSLGDPRGEVIALELSGMPTDALVAQHASEWLPPGTTCRAWRHAQPVHVVWLESTDPHHVGWLGVQELEVEPSVETMGSPFRGELPNLRTVTLPKFIPPQWRKSVPPIETLRLGTADDSNLSELVRVLPKLTRLKKLACRRSLTALGVVDFISKHVPSSFERLELDGFHVSEPELRKLEQRAHPWCVDLVFGVGPRGAEAKDAVWLSVNAEGTRLFVRGSPEQHDVVKAQALAGTTVAVLQIR